MAKDIYAPVEARVVKLETESIFLKEAVAEIRETLKEFAESFAALTRQVDRVQSAVESELGGGRTKGNIPHNLEEIGKRITNIEGTLTGKDSLPSRVEKLELAEKARTRLLWIAIGAAVTSAVGSLIAWVFRH